MQASPGGSATRSRWPVGTDPGNHPTHEAWASARTTCPSGTRSSGPVRPLSADGRKARYGKYRRFQSFLRRLDRKVERPGCQDRALRLSWHLSFGRRRRHDSGITSSLTYHRERKLPKQEPEATGDRLRRAHPITALVDVVYACRPKRAFTGGARGAPEGPHDGMSLRLLTSPSL